MTRRLPLVLVGLATVYLSVGRTAALSLTVPAVVFLWRRGRRGPRMFSAELREVIFRRDGGRCYLCGVGLHYESVCPWGGCPACFEADHVKAWADGGATTLRNGRAACRRHNRAKGARSVDEFLADP